MALYESLVYAWTTTRSLFVYIFFLSLGAYLFVLYRLYSILCVPYDSKPQKYAGRSNRSLAVFLGSGGHTTEALALVSSLNFDKYSPRTYIISEGDTLSAKKAIALELLKKFWWLESPRVMYVESFARVSSLSLSGKLVKPLADRFLVQWPDLVRSDGLGTPQYR
ncbi:unnamed protein product, partial [Rhizoctonia solani]